jgi:ATP-dependent Clp protease, protease subunit
MTHRLIQDGDLVLYGPVGMIDFFGGEGFTATEVISALAEMEGDITVRLNSGGGFAFDGIAISNALKAYDGKVTIVNDAIAASAASIIFMAGAERLMADGAMVMIHNASGFTIGTAKDHTKSAEMLGKLDGELARIYAKAAGKRAPQVRKMMDEETWMDADEAKAQGFATGRAEAKSKDATAFDYRIYAKAPESLKALAQTKGWRNVTNMSDSPAPAGDEPRGAAAHTPSLENDTMTDSEKAAAEAKAAAEKIAAEAAEKAKAEADASAKALAEKAAADATKRAQDITAACQLAGKPEKATAFIGDASKSLADVVTALQAERAKAEEINPHNGNGGHAHDPQASASWDKHIEKVNKRVA